MVPPASAINPPSTTLLSSLYKKNSIISTIALAAISLSVIGCSLTLSSLATNYIMHAAFTNFSPYIASIAALVGMLGWVYISNGIIPDLFYKSAEDLFEEALLENRSPEEREVYIHSIMLRVGIGHLIDYGSSLGAFAGFFFALFSPTFILRSVESLERLSLALYNIVSFLWHSSSYSMLVMKGGDGEALIDIAGRINGTALDKHKLFQALHNFFLELRRNSWEISSASAQEHLAECIHSAFKEELRQTPNSLDVISPRLAYRNKLQELLQANPQDEE